MQSYFRVIIIKGYRQVLASLNKYIQYFWSLVNIYKANNQ